MSQICGDYRGKGTDKWYEVLTSVTNTLYYNVTNIITDSMK